MMKKTVRLANLWLPVVGWCGLIFYLSSLSLKPPSGSFFWDIIVPNSAHLIEYAVLFALFFRAVRVFSLAFFLAIFYAFSDEFHQIFVPTRVPSLADIGMDIAGALLAWLVIWQLLPKAPRQLKNWAKKLGLI